jgi:hypothetical protein
MQESFYKFILESIRKQGISFLILSAVVYYFYFEMESLKKEFLLCNQQLLNLYSDNNTQMQEVILRNTQAFERIEKILDKK